MKISELINELQKYDGNSKVVLSTTRRNEVVNKTTEIEVFKNWDGTIHISTNNKNL